MAAWAWGSHWMRNPDGNENPKTNTVSLPYPDLYS